MGSEFSGHRELYQIRSGRPEDHPFILNSWLHSLYNGNRWSKKYLQENEFPHPQAPIDVYGSIDYQIFFRKYRDFLKRLIQKPNLCIMVCALKEDPDVILGYSVSEPKTLHWVYVKEAWKRLGIARDLIPSDTEKVTHITKVGYRIMPKHWKFDPFAV